MLIGKSIRLERIFNRETRRTIIVPMDHGVSVGPIDGIVDMRKTINDVVEGGANAVLEHKGLVRCGHRRGGKDVGLIVHLSASTNLSPFPNAKTLVGSVEDALKLGADGISVHVNLGDETESRMLREFGDMSSKAADWGMPLLAMIYARGPKVSDEYDPEVIAHCARVGAELGADVVKVNYTGDPESFEHVCDGCCVPVVIAGGPKLDSDRALVQMVSDAIKAGGSGLSMGRNVFQANNPRVLVQALHGVVHEGLDVEGAMSMIEAAGAGE